MQKYILAFDQGTTSSRAIIFDKGGSPVSVAQKEFSQHYPQPGWVEHNPNEIWSTQVGVAAEAILQAGLQAKDIQAIGITNQRETTLVWDRRTGEVVYNAIVWQDRRTSGHCDQLKADGYEGVIREKTGLVIDAYFSATKISWILDNVPGARARAEAGQLLFGTVDTWLIWKMTDGKKHVTDVTNASRTLLYNIHSLTWDSELLQLFNIPASMLPEVKASSEVVGHTSGSLFSTQIPIAGIAGDQQAALFGQMCTKPGMVKNTYGTGCFMLMNIGETPIISSHRLVTTVAWKIGDQVHYALEGSIFIAGAVVQWLRDGLGVISSSEEVEQLAKKATGSDGVYLVPAFVGLGAPHWDQHARGTMVGMTRGTTAAHIARAALESIAYQTYEVLKAMEADAGITIKELRVDGGATANDLLMQFQADILAARVVKPEVTEVTAIGAAYLAGLATGFWTSVEDIQQQWSVSRCYEPDGSLPVESLLNGWERAVKAAKAWV
ncbi:glycerol kinase GlpK [Pontibacter actiniarum]|uniref:Glycerol kinase n=1 Tax=Pontibacter actiniarum TaxID=323450 RepID=A0A1X9YT40_9BACT|nr:glycerol kinase GlpK [Pontibacter actiniarum]ARS35984.1 glycerol kinase [Pontibacter actiniarum]